jgi:cytochrome c oxidase subunit 3
MKSTEINMMHEEQPQLPLSMHPKKFIVWLFIVSIVMMFAGWTSAYIVAQADGAGQAVELPSIFGITTGLLLISSFTMHAAYRAAKKDNLMQLKLFTVLTFVLGVAFLVGQLQGFGKLVDQNVYFVGGTAIDSFTFVLPFMHGVHIIAGLIFLLVVLVKVFKYKVHSKNMVSMEMCSTFWHFLDGLWLYLFLFLQFN